MSSGRNAVFRRNLGAGACWRSIPWHRRTSAFCHWHRLGCLDWYRAVDQNYGGDWRHPLTLALSGLPKIVVFVCQRLYEYPQRTSRPPLIQQCCDKAWLYLVCGKPTLVVIIKVSELSYRTPEIFKRQHSFIILSVSWTSSLNRRPMLSQHTKHKSWET